MKLIFLTLAVFFTGSSDAAKFLRVPQDPFDDGQDHDIGTDPDYYEVEADDADDLHLVEDPSADEGEDDGEEDDFDHGTADDPMGLAEAKEGEEEENDDSLDEDVDPAAETANMPASFLQSEEADDDAAESTESSDSESADASLIQESEEADHHDDAAESTDESVDVDVDADTTEMQSSFLQESEEAESEDADDADEAEDEEKVDELTAKLNEEYSVPDSASLLQEGEALQNIPPERQYLGDLSDSKAHPYVYKTREAATAACQSIGYRGLCGKNQVKGWSLCAYGWMADYKGYWFRKTKRGCGWGKGFRNGKKVKKMGAYCCNLAMNSQYIGSLKEPDAHPYVYSSRSKAAKACRKAGFRGLCAKSQIEGYVQCAAGWLSDSKGYWMD